MRLIKEYCCCAIPLLNAGIYTTLIEQFVVAITVGILSLVTPSIVGASGPSFVPIVFAILCFLAAAVQMFGFMGVFRESTIIFRRYTTLHLLLICAIFSLAAVFIGISASKHSTASADCVAAFFPNVTTAQPTSLTGSATEGKLLCNIFTWIGVGTMAGLWLVLGLFHVYLFFVISGYGSSQRDDHSKYYSLYSLNAYPAPTTEAHLPPDHIGMQDIGQEEAWDPSDNIGYEKPYQRSYNGPMAYRPSQDSAETVYPDVAHTMSPAPTPGYYNGYGDPYYQDAGTEMHRPDPTMTHPAEGSFRRKTPRMTPASQMQSYADGNFDRNFYTPR